jgi:8-oxo-dGTP pyrophosphatase MutT (NUDIX family)
MRSAFIMDIKSQKYKISVNGTWIVLIDLKERDRLVIKEFPVWIMLQSPRINEILNRVQHLIDHTDTLPVIIAAKKPKQVWKKLLGSLPLIYAAGGVVRDPKNRYLFIRRRGWWDLPKGKIDHGESNRKAALREVKEEVGLNCTIDGNLPPTFHMYVEKNRIVLKKTDWYLMSSNGVKPVLQKEEDITDHAWKSIRQLPSMKSKVYPNLAVLLDEILDQ